MSLDFNTVSKVISVIAVVVPLLYGGVHFMVEAKFEGIDYRLLHLEDHASQGERFTKDDGERLAVHVDHHSEEIQALRDLIGTMQSKTAECKVNVGNVVYRLNRLEDKYYSERPNGDGDGNGNIRNAPFIPDPELVDPTWLWHATDGWF